MSRKVESRTTSSSKPALPPVRKDRIGEHQAQWHIDVNDVVGHLHSVPVYRVEQHVRAIDHDIVLRLALAQGIEIGAQHIRTHCVSSRITIGTGHVVLDL